MFIANQTFSSIGFSLAHRLDYRVCKGVYRNEPSLPQKERKQYALPSQQEK